MTTESVNLSAMAAAPAHGRFRADDIKYLTHLAEWWLHFANSYSFPHSCATLLLSHRIVIHLYLRKSFCLGIAVVMEHLIMHFAKP